MIYSTIVSLELIEAKVKSFNKATAVKWRGVRTLLNIHCTKQFAIAI